MNRQILNRDFQHPTDGWYQIEAMGFHPATTEEGERVVQVIDDKAIASIVQRFNRSAAAGTFHHGNEMLIDREHFKHDREKDTTAYGWAQEAQPRADGIYVRNRWTATGKPAVDGGDYRFFSTEYEGAMEEVPESEIPAAIRNQFKGRKFVRPLEMTGLTLTNMPNNRGQKAITNRQKDLPDSPANSPTGEQVDIQNRKKTMKLIAQKLGLSADASEDAILGELGKVQAQATEGQGFKNRVTELETENATLLEGQIEADLATHKVTDEKIINRLKPVLKGMKNRTERVEFIQEVVGRPQADPASPQVQLRNRDGKPPVKKADAEGVAADQAKALKIMNRASALRKEMPNLSQPSAVIMAQREIENEG